MAFAFLQRSEGEEQKRRGDSLARGALVRPPLATSRQIARPGDAASPMHAVCAPEARRHGVRARRTDGRARGCAPLLCTARVHALNPFCFFRPPPPTTPCAQILRAPRPRDAVRSTRDPVIAPAAAIRTASARGEARWCWCFLAPLPSPLPSFFRPRRRPSPPPGTLSLSQPKTHAAPPQNPHRHTTKQQQAKRNEVSDSYAKALVDLAEEKSQLEAVHADVDAVAGLVRDNAKLRNLLFDPVLPADKKRAVVAKLSREASFNKYTTNFLNLLIAKGRVQLLDEICEAFEEEYCRLTDTQVATLRSAVRLEQEQQFLIAKKLQELTGSKNIKLKPVIDQSLIAGFVVEYGSSQIDLSVRGQVAGVADQLARQLAAQV